MSADDLKKRRLDATCIVGKEGDEIGVNNPKKIKVQDDSDSVRDEAVEEGQQLSSFRLKLNSRLQNPEFLQELKSTWSNKFYESAEGPKVKIGSEPFPYCECNEVLADSSILHKLQETLEYEEKSSDLFHFHQSCDLNSLASEAESFQPVQAIKDFFQVDLFNFIKTITSLPLNGKFDIFASQYEFNDHLLCHDDELDSRRIAFIIYMSEGWQPDFGGTLDLFDSIESDEGNPQPGVIVKSLCPEFNKLVFFEVTAKSFHQVSEVLKQEGDCRRAISGWFYGDPLPRPPVQLPVESFESVNFMEQSEIPLDEYLDDSYINSENLKVVNEKLSENSEILLSNFFKNDVYPAVLKELECVDDSKWTAVGPANLQKYETLKSGVPEVLLTFFRSKTFLEFLQELTEFPFASEPELRFTVSLKKFRHGSYTLVRGKDRSYRIKNLATAGVDRLEKVLSDSEESLAGSDSVGDVEELNEDGDIEGEYGQKNENGVCETTTNGTAKGDSASNEETEEKSDNVANTNDDKIKPNSDSGSEEEIIWEPEGSDEEEEAEEPNRVDVMFFIVPAGHVEQEADTPKENIEDATMKNENGIQSKIVTDSKWNEKWGGCRIYTDDLTGNALINLIPADNSLAIVVRDESISSHYSYVNCLAQDRVFYSYDFEFNFPRASSS